MFSSLFEVNLLTLQIYWRCCSRTSINKMKSFLLNMIEFPYVDLTTNCIYINSLIGIYFHDIREEKKLRNFAHWIHQRFPKHNATPIYTLRQTNTSSRICTTI